MFFHRLRLALIVAAVLALVPVVVVGSSTSAEALQGCPPQSSICNPGALATIAATNDTALAASIGTAGTVAASTTGVSASSSVITAGSTLAVGVFGYGATQVVVDTVNTALTREVGTPGGVVEYYESFLVFRSATFPPFSAAAQSGSAGNIAVTVTNRCGAVLTYANYETCANGIEGGSGGLMRFKIYYASGSTAVSQPSWGAVAVPGSSPQLYDIPAVHTYTIPVNNAWNRLCKVATSTGPDMWCIYPEGHNQWTEPVPGGFVGEFQISQSCLAPGGVVTSSVRGIQVSSTDGEVPVDIPEGKCAAREVLQSVLVEWVTSQGREVVYEWSAPDWVIDIPTEYPDCLDTQCYVELWMVTGSGLDWCGQAAVGCQNWWKDSDKVDHYVCKYGPYTVNLGYCAMFRVPGSITGTVPYVITEDGSKQGKNPIVSTDPKDFEELDRQIGRDRDPKPTPDPDPVPTPEPEPIPEGGGSACWPQGWGVWNPLEWVYRPITCALAWAWVPEPGPLMEETDAVVKTGLLGDLGGEISAFDDVSWPGESSSCSLLYQGSPSVFQGQTLTVTPCGPIATGVAGVVKPLLTGVIFIGGIIIAVAVILQAFDVNIMMGRAEQAADR